MYQVTIKIQGNEHASLRQIITTLDHVKSRIVGGAPHGSQSSGGIGYEFEVREVDSDHALQHLLGASTNGDARS